MKQVEHIRKTPEGKPFVAGTYPISIKEFIRIKIIGIDRLTEDMVENRDFEVTTEPLKKYGFRMRLHKIEYGVGYYIYLDYILPRQSGYVFEIYVSDFETAKEAMKQITSDIISLNAFGKRVGYKLLKECIENLKNTWEVRILRSII